MPRIGDLAFYVVVVVYCTLGTIWCWLERNKGKEQGIWFVLFFTGGVQQIVVNIRV
jgi:hypothetical protein